jgi:hypothetical protein
MIYHHPSLTGLLLWARYGIGRKSVRQAVYEHLESPGTKSYTQREAHQLMNGFENIRTEVVFSPGDLLLNEPSSRFQSSLYRVGWKIYPRWIVRSLAKKWGLFLLITGQKPVDGKAGI